MRIERIIKEMKKNPKNIRFKKLCKVVESYGFKFKGGKGSRKSSVI